jgi:hypothetical protein
MDTNETPKKAGRPPIILDKEQVTALSFYHLTMEEMAQFFKCDRNTLTNNYSAEIAKGRADGKMRLRKKQFEVAMKGNTTMLIWLGKQILGQNDNETGDDNTPLPITDIL